MADFQQHKPEFDALGAAIVALSSDPEKDAAETVQRFGLEFPVAYGLDAEATALTIGCYTGVREGCAHVQPSSFVLTGEGTIAHAVYSTGKVGRLSAKDALVVLRERVPSTADSR